MGFFLGVIRLDLVTFGGLRLTGRSPRVHSLIVHKTFSTPNPVLSRVHSLLCQQPSSVCYQGLITLEERHHHRGRFAFRVDENSVTGGGPVTDENSVTPGWSWASRLGLACTQHTTLLHPLEVIFVLLGYQRCVLGSSHLITNGIGAIV